MYQYIVFDCCLRRRRVAGSVLPAVLFWHVLGSNVRREARRLPAATKQHHLLADRWVKEELDDVPDTPAKDVGWKDKRPRHRLWEVVGQA